MRVLGKGQLGWVLSAALVFGAGIGTARAASGDATPETTWPQRAGEAHAKTEGHPGVVAKVPDTSGGQRSDETRRNGASGESANR